jgi:hypothetical protein
MTAPAAAGTNTYTVSANQGTPPGVASSTTFGITVTTPPVTTPPVTQQRLVIVQPIEPSRSRGVHLCDCGRGSDGRVTWAWVAVCKRLKSCSPERAH